MVVAVQLSGPIDVALGRDFMALVPLNSKFSGLFFCITVNPFISGLVMTWLYA